MAKILIIDDNINIITLIKKYLLDEEHTLDFAMTTDDALGLIKTNVYDIILSDLKMSSPDNSTLGGIYLTKYSRKLLKNTEIIIMTGCNSVETAINAMKAGAFDYILKPFSKQVLIDKINRISQYREFLNPDNTIPAFKQLYTDVLTISGFAQNHSNEEISDLIHSIEKKIDYFFQSQKKCEQFILIQLEALTRISAYAEQLLEMVPKNSNESSLVDKIITESMKRV